MRAAGSGARRKGLMSIYEFEGHRPVLPASGEFYIAPNASVIGKVSMGHLTSVWFSATVRGDNDAIVIGDRSNVQDSCVLHTDPGYPMVIGEGVTVGHLAMLDGCTIGGNTLIGSEIVAKAQPNGYTILIVAAGHAINVAVAAMEQNKSRELIMGRPERQTRNGARSP